VDLSDGLDELVLWPDPVENVRHHCAGLGLDSDAHLSTPRFRLEAADGEELFNNQLRGILSSSG
jgi:hypothetical protein